jgi:hypothetical protein
MEWEDEETWLRGKIVRLRAISRYARVESAEAALKEFVAEAETRLELLQSRRLRPLDIDEPPEG